MSIHRELLMRHPKPAAAATIAAALLLASGPPPARAGTVAIPPAGVIALTGRLPEAVARADDGTTYVLQYVDAEGGAELDVFPPGATGPDAPTVIENLGSVDMDLDPRYGLAATDQTEKLIVLDPAQPAGPVIPLRTIDGPDTQIADVVSVAWADDGSLWVSNYDAGAVELLQFAPGAEGDVAPVRVIAGPRTGLVAAGSGIQVDTLPDGSVVAGAPGSDLAVLVFDAAAEGDVAPARRITVPTPTVTSYQFGIAVDARGRIHVTVGDLDGSDHGHLFVFAEGASGKDAPVLDVTGEASRLHIPLYPTVAPDGDVALLDAVFVNNEVGAVRVLSFDPLPTRPAAPRSLTARRTRSSVAVGWRAPADDGGAAVDAYRVQVLQRGRVVLSRQVAGGTTRLAVRRGRLPRGRLIVRVSAQNVAGRGPVATATVRAAAGRTG